MSKTCHTDKDGYKHWIIEYDGLILPSFKDLEGILSELPSMPIRDDDVLLLSFPKSGTHWCWEILNMVINGSTENRGQFFLEYSKQENFVSDEARVLNSHLRYRLLPTEIFDKKIKTVFVARNLKDIAVSFYCHYKVMDNDVTYDGSFDNFLDIFLEGKLGYGGWFDYMLEWQHIFEDRPDWPVHTVLYEDLKENPAKEIQRLASFLGRDSDMDFCTQIADKCHIDRLKKSKADVPDAKLYRKGIVGDWKNYFTQEQNEKFEEIYNEKSKDLKLKFRFEI